MSLWLKQEQISANGVWKLLILCRFVSQVNVSWFKNQDKNTEEHHMFAMWSEGKVHTFFAYSNARDSSDSSVKLFVVCSLFFVKWMEKYWCIVSRIFKFWSIVHFGSLNFIYWNILKGMPFSFINPVQHTCLFFCNFRFCKWLWLAIWLAGVCLGLS